MSSKDTSSCSTTNPSEVILHDLQSLLRKTISNDVIVVDYTTKALLPKGENYGSMIMKVDAVIKKNKNSKEETLFLVAKMVPATEFQKNMLNITESFGKEIFVFEKLIDAYRQIETKSGVHHEELIDVLPKFYGGRLSRKENVNEGDEDAVLLMENLKMRNYYTMDRTKGMDLEHAKLAISELARFHALGFGLRQSKPDFFEEIKNCVNKLSFKTGDTSGSEINGLLEQTINTICVDPRINKYKDRIEKSIKMKNWNVFYEFNIVEPWITVIHGDFWVNNVMFHKSENGRLDSVKFVDYQLVRVCSPLKDLPYFLCGSMNTEVIDNHFDEVLDVYYNRFIDELKIIGYDVTPFSRCNFDEQLKKDGNEELFHCLLAIKFCTFDMPEDFDLNNMMFGVIMTGASNLYLERSWRVVSKFVEKGWL